MDRNDVGVPQPGQMAGLLQEALHNSVEGRLARPQYFDSYLPAERLLQHKINDPHASTTQFADNLVILRQLGWRLVRASRARHDRLDFCQGVTKDGVPLNSLLELAAQVFRYFGVFSGQVGFDEILEVHSSFP